MEDGVRETHYERLGVAEDASAEEIREAYRRLVRDLHPDNKSPAYKEHFGALMSGVNEARDVLTDESKRSDYDLLLRQEREREAAGEGGGCEYQESPESAGEEDREAWDAWEAWEKRDSQDEGEAWESAWERWEAEAGDRASEEDHLRNSERWSIFSEETAPAPVNGGALGSVEGALLRLAPFPNALLAAIFSSCVWSASFALATLLDALWWWILLLVAVPVLALPVWIASRVIRASRESALIQEMTGVEARSSMPVVIAHRTSRAVVLGPPFVFLSVLPVVNALYGVLALVSVAWAVSWTVVLVARKRTTRP